MNRHVFVILLPVALVAAGCGQHDVVPTTAPAAGVTNRPVVHRSEGYTGSDACRSCHTRQHATWHQSWHRTMTQVATPQSVMGRFDTHLQHDGLRFQLSQDADNLWLTTLLPASATAPAETFRRPVVLSTGSHHMQAYWFSIADDTRAVGLMPFVYLQEASRWVPRNAAFLRPDEPLTDEAGRWNYTCIKCHVTHGRTFGPKLADMQDALLRDADTQVSEFGIACEACHGPGQTHVAHHAQQPPTENAAATVIPGDVVNPASLPHKLQSQVCGQCHSIYDMQDAELLRWLRDGWDFRPGDDMADSRIRQFARCDPDYRQDHPDTWATQFWSDGMVRISGREYNGLSESPCFKAGQLSCLHCHQLHQLPGDVRDTRDWADDQLGVGMRGNAACVQCHEHLTTPPALTAHTHHAADSSGSQCYNCHMPHTTYGLLKAIRSHQIDSPDVAVTLQTGRPNACNQCHLDRPLSWTAQQLSAWYDRPQVDVPEEHTSVAASLVWLLRGDAGQRALLAWSFGWDAARAASGDNWMAPYLAELLNDPYDAVRYIAARSLRRLPGFRNLEYDFVGPAAQRQAARQQVLRIWAAQATDVPPPRAGRVLIRSPGQLNQPAVSRLLDQRDNRPVRLAE